MHGIDTEKRRENLDAERAVAKATYKAYDEIYMGMETSEGMKSSFRFAKQRHRDSTDTQHVKM